MNDFGFIIVRHVNSEITNKYWKHNVRCIRNFYSEPNIVIIDDNSDINFLKESDEDKYVTVIQSELPGKGELLGYYYLHSRKLFKKAIVIHDSCFFHRKIEFDSMTEPCKFIWDFPGGHYEYDSLNGIKYFKQEESLVDLFQKKNIIRGCFGCQSMVTLDFLEKIVQEYNFFNLLNYITSRHERFNSERLYGLVCIHALINYYQYPENIGENISILGNVIEQPRWGISWDEYLKILSSGEKIVDKNNNGIYLFKVFSGR
jgi:hypothetical protein